MNKRDQSSDEMHCYPRLPTADVIHGLKTLAAQERKTQSLLTGPRDAPAEFERWYVAQIIESAARIIEENADVDASADENQSNQNDQNDA
jgi:hypothetical protein